MKFDIVTVLPRMVNLLLQEGVLGRAVERGVLDVEVHDLRDFSEDRHRVVDDVPYGGGPGMVLKAKPLLRAVEFVTRQRGKPGAIVVTSPQGCRFSHDEALRLSRLSHVTVLCGRYEGIDERVRERVATEEISIGDYVLTGGELPAMVILEAVARLVRGVVGDAQSVEGESFVRNLLDFPQYTRPAEFQDMTVPAVLLSGHHGEIRRWRKREAVRRTLERRPDLLAGAVLDEEERQLLRELLEARDTRAKV